MGKLSGAWKDLNGSSFILELFSSSAPGFLFYRAVLNAWRCASTRAAAVGSLQMSHPVKRTWFCITWHGLWHCQYRLLWWQSSFSHLVVSSLDNLISNFTMFCAHQDNAEEGTFQVWLRQGDETQSEVEIVIQGIPASVVWAMLSFDLALLLNFLWVAFVYHKYGLCAEITSCKCQLLDDLRSFKGWNWRRKGWESVVGRNVTLIRSLLSIHEASCGTTRFFTPELCKQRLLSFTRAMATCGCTNLNKKVMLPSRLRA